MSSGQTLRCRTLAGGGFQQVNHLRDLPPLVVAENAGEAGLPTPSELLLAALGSCLGAHIHANAAAGNIVVHRLEIAIEADLAASPMWGPSGHAPPPVGFETIRVAVHLHADAPGEALRALVAHAALWSPVANTIHDPVHLDVTVDGQAGPAS